MKGKKFCQFSIFEILKEHELNATLESIVQQVEPLVVHHGF